VWEGDQGEDVAYANEESKVGLTPYREHSEFKPFGPVDNGSQILYGLDYRMAAWRGTEENPFHTEVGYWLWDSTAFTLHAAVGSETYGILSNKSLATQARTIRYEVSVDLSGDGVFAYQETSVIEHAKLPEPLIHTDRNTLRRIAEA
jgi:hypothetical protein